MTAVWEQENVVVLGIVVRSSIGSRFSTILGKL